MSIVLSFYDYTGEAVKPWATAGYDCYCFDIQHSGETIVEHGKGRIFYTWADLHSDIVLNDIVDMFKDRDVKLVLGFPPCTDLAVSGARHFEAKRKANPHFQLEATAHAMMIAQIAEKLRVPYAIENPISVLSTLWRRPDYKFDPFEYGGYIAEEAAEHPTWPDYIAPRDAYSKKTCIWSGNGFIMPELKPVDCESYGSSRQHRKLGGKSIKTKNIRSATPRGFAIAVFEANA